MCYGLFKPCVLATQLGKTFMLPRPMFVLEVVQAVYKWH
jgi:hypothetical protein